jgi:uncharacterized damage-inducible protein DinB
MSIAASLLPEFDHEMANTRTTLSRVPMDKADWKPHERSGTLQWLAGHLAVLPMWATETVQNSEFDMDNPTVEIPGPPDTTEELLALFDRNAAAARAALEGASDETLLGMWTLKGGGQEVFTMPRIGVIRSFVMNHMVHHRGQLTVYLRLHDVPVPALYGPSADEGAM